MATLWPPRPTCTLIMGRDVPPQHTYSGPTLPPRCLPPPLKPVLSSYLPACSFWVEAAWLRDSLPGSGAPRR